MSKSGFSPDCRCCPRLSGFLQDNRDRFPDYYNLPVPSFGPDRPAILIVGLAPGLHGANATGRPFTGDHAGILLYRTLYEHGLATEAESIAANDSLRLLNCRITNAVRCVPPQNKPVLEEVRHCNGYLAEELARIRKGGVVLCLGGIAHRAVLDALGLKKSAHPFGHDNSYPLEGGTTLLDSYHCSRYNTQTRRLTPDMFSEIFTRATRLAGLRDEG